MQWTDELDARLTALWREGQVKNRIADILAREFGLPITKNMVIGRGRRMRLPMRYPPNKEPDPALLERDEQIRQRNKLGQSNRQIAIALGCEASTVTEVLAGRRAMLDIPFPNETRDGRRKPDKPQRDARLVAMVKQGRSMREVARLEGVSKDIVYEAVKATRGERPPKPKPEVREAVAIVRPPRVPWVSGPIAPPRQCCFPIGDPKQKGFRFCDEPPVFGLPYCDEHCGIAYVTYRSREAA